MANAGEVKSLNWRMLFVRSVIAVPVIIGALWVAIQIADRFDLFGRRQPNLVPVPPDQSITPPAPRRLPENRLVRNQKTPAYAPYGIGLPTVVSVRNTGDGEAMVQSVKFQIVGQKRTPKRDNVYGQGETIHVTFRNRHLNRKDNVFTLRFQKPKPAPGDGEYTPLEVAIVEPNWVGNTYVGKLTINYADGDPVTLENVELDVLSRLPKLPE